MRYVDPSGLNAYIFYIPEWEAEAKDDRKKLMGSFNLKKSQVHLTPITSTADLSNEWNAMDDSIPIEAVIINSYANYKELLAKYKGNGDRHFDVLR